MRGSRPDAEAAIQHHQRIRNRADNPLRLHMTDAQKTIKVIVFMREVLHPQEANATESPSSRMTNRHYGATRSTN
jgi:hypothetical protein